MHIIAVIGAIIILIIGFIYLANRSPSKTDTGIDMVKLKRICLNANLTIHAFPGKQERYLIKHKYEIDRI